MIVRDKPKAYEQVSSSHFSAGTSLFYEKMSAHKLEGDVSKFAVLDHIDTGEPKTTDLDSIAEEVREVGESISEKSMRHGEPTSGKMDREDIVTVKYLPIKMSPQTESDEEATESLKEDYIDSSNLHKDFIKQNDYQHEEIEKTTTTENYSTSVTRVSVNINISIQRNSLIYSRELLNLSKVHQLPC